MGREGPVVEGVLGNSAFARDLQTAGIWAVWFPAPLLGNWPQPVVFGVGLPRSQPEPNGLEGYLLRS